MIHTILQQLIDTVLPPPAAVRTCRSLTPNDITHLLSPRHDEDITALLPFAEPVVRALIHANKFHHNRHAQHLLAHALTLGLSAIIDEGPVFVVPIPLGPARERERGHNQVMSILSLVDRTQLPNLTIHPSLLRRIRETPMQSHLGRAERLKNVTDSFKADSAELAKYPPRHVIIVDDVVTTGATLRAAAQAVQPHLPATTTLSLLALAH